MEDTLIMVTIILAFALLLVLIYAHAITKEAWENEDKYRQATNHLKRVNRELRNAEFELIVAHIETVEWKEKYLSMTCSDKDFSQL